MRLPIGTFSLPFSLFRVAILRKMGDNKHRVARGRGSATASVAFEKLTDHITLAFFKPVGGK